MRNRRGRPSTPAEIRKWQEPLSQALRDMLPSTAHHEAGHAVIAYLCGFQVKKVSVLPRPLNDQECAELATDGRNRYAVGEAEIEYSSALIDGEVRDIVSLKPFAMSYLAGRLAQVKAGFGQSPSDAEHDAAVVTLHASKLLGKSAGQWIEMMTAETQRLLGAEDVRAAVTLTVNLLLERGSLTEEEFLLEVSPLFAARKFLGCGF